MPRATQEHRWRRDAASDKGLSPSAARLSRRFSSPRHQRTDAGPTTPGRPRPTGFGLCPVRSPLLGVSLLFSLPPATKMFQFAGFASAHSARMTGHHPAGLPHSDTPGSKAACASPGIFAACRVLHRLPEPRHPPCALSFFLRLTHIAPSLTIRGGGRPPSAPPRQTCRGRRNYAGAFYGGGAHTDCLYARYFLGGALVLTD